MSNVPSVPSFRTLRFKRSELKDAHYAAANIVYLLMEHGVQSRKELNSVLLHPSSSVEEALAMLKAHEVIAEASVLGGSAFGIRPVVGQEIYEALKSMPAESRSVINYFTMEGYFQGTRRHTIMARAFGA